MPVFNGCASLALAFRLAHNCTVIVQPVSTDQFPFFWAMPQYRVGSCLTPMQQHIMKALNIFKNKNTVRQFIVYTTNIRKDIYLFESLIMFCMCLEKGVMLKILFLKTKSNKKNSSNRFISMLGWMVHHL